MPIMNRREGGSFLCVCILTQMWIAQEIEVKNLLGEANDRYLISSQCFMIHSESRNYTDFQCLVFLW